MLRRFARANADTFASRPIAALLDRWLAGARVVVDPFARNSRRGTHRNDCDPATEAPSHLDARDYCARLLAEGVVADVVLLDPPYSPRQIAECYRQIGRPVYRADTQNARLYREVRDRLDPLLRAGGVAVSCGWSGVGFGRRRGYEACELLLVTHGGAHHDTIVVVERKGALQAKEGS